MQIFQSRTPLTNIPSPATDVTVHGQQATDRWGHQPFPQYPPSSPHGRPATYADEYPEFAEFVTDVIEPAEATPPTSSSPSSVSNALGLISLSRPKVLQGLDKRHYRRRIRHPPLLRLWGAWTSQPCHNSHRSIADRTDTRAVSRRLMSATMATIAHSIAPSLAPSLKAPPPTREIPSTFVAGIKSWWEAGTSASTHAEGWLLRYVPTTRLSSSHPFLTYPHRLAQGRPPASSSPSFPHPFHRAPVFPRLTLPLRPTIAPVRHTPPPWSLLPPVSWSARSTTRLANLLIARGLGPLSSTAVPISTPSYVKSSEAAIFWAPLPAALLISSNVVASVSPTSVTSSSTRLSEETLAAIRETANKQVPYNVQGVSCLCPTVAASTDTRTVSRRVQQVSCERSPHALERGWKTPRGEADRSTVSSIELHVIHPF